MKYDYLAVGADLYGAIFAYEAKALGKSVFVVDKRGCRMRNETSHTA